MNDQNNPGGSTKVGWRVIEFANDSGLSRSTIWNRIADGSLKTVKVGKAHVIVTSPAEFLASKAAEPV